MSRFKISNQIFTLGLDAQEISIYAYLCSLPSLQNTLDDRSTVRVKQSTIAQKCGFKAVQTVSKVISRLADKGLVEPLRRSVKANRHKGTYSYAIKQLPTDSCYFFVDRHIFGKLSPRQMLIYLFICKMYSPKLNDSWNSYSDIAAQTGMKRELVIQTINELVELKLITRCHRKAQENRHMFVDNHYQIIFWVRGTLKGKKKVRLYCEYSHTGSLHSRQSKTYNNHSTFLLKCQEEMRYFLMVRGSP